MTGDVRVESGATLTLEAGTIMLIAARSDDQESGEDAPFDSFNPKDPVYEGKARTALYVAGSLIVEGTREDPVIITSDSENPQNDDWGELGLNAQDDSRIEITRAIIEFTRIIGIDSSSVVVRKSILRNIMEGVVIGRDMCNVTPDNALGLSPTITQNHIYNTGRHSITVRNGSPTITHNVIRARPDLETTGWEHGALGVDFPSCVVVQYNYLDGGTPHLYRGEISGAYHEYTQPKSAGIRGICNLSFSYNTLTGSPIALESHAGDWSMENNNILPVAAPVAATSEGWSNDQLLGLFAHDAAPEPSDTCQFDFLETIGGVPLMDTVLVPNNYWGTRDSGEIERRLKAGVSGLGFEYEPFKAEFITEALPDWGEFEW